MDGKLAEMNDEALEREIEAALGVDPSPEFLPRIRARVANERMQEGWFSSASWRWAGAAAVVTAVAILAVWTLSDPATAPRDARTVDVPSNPENTEARTPNPDRTEPRIPGPEPRIPGPEPRIPDPGQRRRSPQLAAASQLEVLISPDEAAGLKQLFTAIGSRRLETFALPDLQSALKPPAPIEEIVLEPITISPLAALEGE